MNKSITSTANMENNNLTKVLNSGKHVVRISPVPLMKAVGTVCLMIL